MPFDWSSAVRTHRHTVVLALLSSGAPLDLAQELAHDAFVRLFEQWASGALTTIELPGLAIRQAMFLLTMQRRASSRAHARVAPLEEASGVAHASTSAPELVEARQALDSALETLRRCTPRQRAVLGAVLERPEAPQTELARHEGVSLQRFRQVLCEVRAHLRVAWEKAR